MPEKLFKNYFDKKNIFITGGSGYIANHLIKDLSKYNSNIYILSSKKNKNKKNIKFIHGKLNEFSKFKSSLSKCDIIFHLGFNNSIDDITKNFKLNKKIQTDFFKELKAIHSKSIVKKVLIFTSTVTIYGNHKKSINEYSEDKLFTKYDLLKLECENFIKLNLQNYNFKCVNLRLSNIYGKSDSSLGSRNILFKIIKNALIKKEINMIGNGNFMRNYLYIDDLVKALKLSVLYSETLSQYAKINLCSSNTIKFENLMKKIQLIMLKKFKTKIKINKQSFSNYSAVDLRNFRCKPSLFIRITKWKEKINLEKSIFEIIKVIKNEFKKI